MDDDDEEDDDAEDDDEDELDRDERDDDDRARPSKDNSAPLRRLCLDFDLD